MLFRSWRLNHLLFGDDYSQPSVDLIADIEPLYLDHPDAILDRQPDAMTALFHALLLTGAAMTLAGTSAPASGAEHLISHTLDLLVSIDGVPHDLHGRQVGLATILMAELYQRVLAVESPDFRDAPAQIDAAYWARHAPAIAGHHAKKRDRLAAARTALAAGNAWDNLRADLAPRLRRPAVIRDCLAAARAAHQAEHIGCAPDRLADVLRHAHEIRSRFTILDLAWIVGILPDAPADPVDQWA